MRRDATETDPADIQSCGHVYHGHAPGGRELVVLRDQRDGREPPTERFLKGRSQSAHPPRRGGARATGNGKRDFEHRQCASGHLQESDSHLRHSGADHSESNRRAAHARVEDLCGRPGVRVHAEPQSVLGDHHRRSVPADDQRHQFPQSSSGLQPELLHPNQLDHLARRHRDHDYRPPARG